MFFRRCISLVIIGSFLGSSVVSLGAAPGVPVTSVMVDALPSPGEMVQVSQPFEPLMIKGLTLHPDKPLQFDFLVSTGDDVSLRNSGVIASEAKQSLNAQGIASSPSAPRNDAAFKATATRLIKYFLACLAIPEDDLWVNLSPYEKDQMIPQTLSQTELGRDLLAQDYILKQLSASMIYPDKGLGKEFWDRVYTKARQLYGTTEIPVNTFNKVWILADTAKVFEHGNTAMVVSSHLKVMLDKDYLAMSKNADKQDPDVSSLGSQIIRDLILPEIEKEINTGKHFATIRQIFHAFILASWYKKNLKTAILNQVYTDKNKVQGLQQEMASSSDRQDRSDIENIYQRYLAAYKKGVFNYIKEDDFSKTPRKYFSGGTKLASSAVTTVNRRSDLNPVEIAATQEVDYAVTANLKAAVPNEAMSTQVKPTRVFRSVSRRVRKRQVEIALLSPEAQQILVGITVKGVGVDAPVQGGSFITQYRDVRLNDFLRGVQNLNRNYIAHLLRANPSPGDPLFQLKEDYRMVKGYVVKTREQRRNEFRKIYGVAVKSYLLGQGRSKYTEAVGFDPVFDSWRDHDSSIIWDAFIEVVYARFSKIKYKLVYEAGEHKIKLIYEYPKKYLMFIEDLSQDGVLVEPTSPVSSKPLTLTTKVEVAQAKRYLLENVYNGRSGVVGRESLVYLALFMFNHPGMLGKEFQSVWAVKVIGDFLSKNPQGDLSGLYVKAFKVFDANQQLFKEEPAISYERIVATAKNVIGITLRNDPWWKKYLWALDIDRDRISETLIASLESIVQRAANKDPNAYEFFDLPVLFAMARYKGENKKVEGLRDEARVKLREFALMALHISSTRNYRGGMNAVAQWMDEIIDVWDVIHGVMGDSDIKKMTLEDWVAGVIAPWSKTSGGILYTIASLARVRIGDTAMNTPDVEDQSVTRGGIDLKAQDLKLEIQQGSDRSEITFDPAMMAQFRSGDFTGLVPVIIKVTPIAGGLSRMDLTPVLTQQ